MTPDELKTESLPAPDPHQVLREAEATLAQRNNLSLSYRVNQIEYVVSPATGTPGYKAESEGTLLLSAGRWRAEHPPSTPGASRSLDVWNGSTYKNLYTFADNPARDRGWEAPAPRNGGAGRPLWLLTARLGHVPLRVAHLSMFEHLLRFGSNLQAQVFREPVPGSNTSCSCSLPREDRLRELRSALQVIRITGKLPWGDYEIWLDPMKDHRMTRMVANLGRIEESNGSERYETLGIVNTQIAGIGWVPTSCTLLHTYTLYAEECDQLHNVIFTDVMEIELTDLAPRSPTEPDDLFDIPWPAGVRVDHWDL